MHKYDAYDIWSRDNVNNAALLNVDGDVPTLSQRAHIWFIYDQRLRIANSYT